MPEERPGDPKYRASLPGDLVLRWATADDLHGILMTGGIAFAVTNEEGKEKEEPIRLLERLFTPRGSDDHAIRDWAICVSTTGPCYFERNPSKDPDDPGDTPYVAEMRRKAAQSQEPVMATLGIEWMKCAFDGGITEVDVAQVGFLAARSECRKKQRDANVVEGLFKMFHDRAKMKQAKLCFIMGIRNYYKAFHGYEYAWGFGPRYLSNVAKIPRATDSSFAFRPANPGDVSDLERLHEQPACSSDLWMRASNVEEYIRSNYHLFLDDDDKGRKLNPFGGEAFVLERVNKDKSKKVVGAVVLSRPDVASDWSSLGISRFLYDEQDSPPQIVRELVAHSVVAGENKLEEIGKEKQLSTRPVLREIWWPLSRGSNVIRWLEAFDFAQQDLIKGYDHMWATSYIRIPSLIEFIISLTPVLNHRLSNAHSLLGSKSEFTLRLLVYTTSILGVTIHISNLKVVSVQPLTATRGGFGYGTVKEDEKANVLAPMGALTMILMGHKHWREVKAIHPDVIIEPEIQPVFEVCFPVRTVGSHFYL